jgi:ribosomal protein S1
MSENKNNLKTTSDFAQLLEKEDLGMPKVGDIIKGIVITASKAEVKLDINGVVIGVVRGPELYEEADEYDDLKPGSTVEATVIDEENENGELELSFRVAGQEKAWATLKDAYENKNSIKVKIIEANKGGLLARYKQIQGFIPVSQLAPDNYPRVSGGDKSKILEKLRSFIGQEFEVKPITLDEKEDKIIFSEKDIWSEKQKDVIAKYQVGTKVEGAITAVTDFGVFISFGENLEGLIHISELAWQRIDDPNILYKVGDKIKAEVISVERSKIFLSAKNLLKDPWKDVEKKYKAGQIVKGKILKVNPFGLFVELDDDIHGLAHASQLEVSAGKKINDMFNSGEERDFEIVSIEPKEHRLGLKLADDKKEKKAKKEDEKEEELAKEDKVDEEEVEAKEEKKKKPVKEKKEKKEDEGKK